MDIKYKKITENVSAFQTGKSTKHFLQSNFRDKFKVKQKPDDRFNLIQSI